MARRIRIQFPGARYHIINRGNYRHDVFTSEGAWQAFIRTFGEEFRQNRWQQELEVGLAQIGQTLDDAAVAPKTISWKLELAYRLRQASAPPYSWIAKTLRMGAASSVRAALSRRLQQPAG